MKPGKTRVDLKESELLDEVHKTEREIDLYLKERAAEAEKILEEAEGSAQAEQELIAREAGELFEEERRQLIEKAKSKAAAILEEGRRLAEKEQKALQERRDAISGKLLEIILGGQS